MAGSLYVKQAQIHLLIVAFLFALLIPIPLIANAQTVPPTTPSTTNPSTTSPLSPGGSAIPFTCTGSVPVCYGVNVATGTTTYTSTAGNGQICLAGAGLCPALTTTVTNPTPVIAQVISDNNKNSAYLITCPTAPNPTNSILYISYPGSYIGGDRCLASSVTPLITTVSYTNRINPNPAVPVEPFYQFPGITTGPPPVLASASYVISNMASGSITNLGFSGETTTSNGVYNLSNAYDSQSYIFQTINSSPQQDLWTWNVEYANLSKVNKASLSLTYVGATSNPTGFSIPIWNGFAFGILQVGPVPVPAIYPVMCQETYNIGLVSNVVTLTNANLSVPVYNSVAGGTSTSGLFNGGGNNNYVVIGGYLYSPVTTISSSGSCYTQISNGGPGCGATEGNWLKIGFGASAYYNGQMYTNLPIYVAVTNSMNINQFKGKPKTSTLSTIAGALGLSGNGSGLPTNSIAYLVPVTTSGTFGSGSGSTTLLEAIAPNAITFANVSIFPYFTYTASVPAVFAQFTLPTSLTMSYDIYSPNNYAGINMKGSTQNYFSLGSISTPSGGAINTFIEPYNVYSGSGLFATYPQSATTGLLGLLGASGSTNETIELPYNVTGAANGIFVDQFPLIGNVVPPSGDLTIWAVYSVNGYSSAVGGGVTVGEGASDQLSAQCQSGNPCTLQYCSMSAACEPSIPLGTAGGSGSASYTCSTTGSSVCNTIGTYFINACESPSSAASGGYAFSLPTNLEGYECSDTEELIVTSASAAAPIELPTNCNSGVISTLTNLIPTGSTSPNCTPLLTPTFQVTQHYENPDGTVTTTTNVIVNNQLSSPPSISQPKGVHGTLGFVNITNPAFITESPDGYVYIINYSQSSGLFGLTSTSQATLFTLKFIPTGDYNYSVYQPTRLTKQSTSGNWIQQSQRYFESSLLAHTPQLYIVNETKFAANKQSFLGTFTNGKSKLYAPFIPLAASSDLQDDLFLIGAPLSGSGYYSGSSFAFAEISGQGGVTEQTNINQPSGFVPSQEFAASPGGEFVYAANYSDPEINIYSTYGGVFTYVGNIPLSYSNESFNFDIGNYLMEGGPYYNSIVSSANPASSSGGQTFDVPANHHPLAITAVGGTLFVVDDWTFTANGQQSAIWMLRAFTENGVEVPLGSNANDLLIPVPSTTPSAAINPFSSNIISTTWPPYGWPIAANIGGTTFCVYTGSGGCTSYGNTSTYTSIGPQIDQYGAVNTNADNKDPVMPADLGISSDFNGNIYLIIHDTISSSPYTEMLILRSTIENYTQISTGATPYTCYLNVSSGSSTSSLFSSTTTSNNNGGCITDQFITNLHPPLLGMPDAFSYVTSLGTPLQLFNIPSGLAALFPEGIPSNTAAANSLFGNGIFPGQSTASLNYNALTTNALTPTSSQLPPKSPFTYLESKINGYVITPYHINYTQNTTWQFTNYQMIFETPDVDYLETVCDFGDNTIYSPSYNNGKAVTPSAASIALASQTSTPTTAYNYTFTNIFNYQTNKLSSNVLVQTIEGGQLYLTNTGTGANYIPSVSDAGMIVPPYLAFRLYSSRVLGEIYINQSASAGSSTSLGGLLPGSLGSLLGMGMANVINASRNFNYSEDTYYQESTFGTSTPAYYAQNAIPTGNSINNTILGANCASCSGSGLSASSLLSGGSLLGTNYYYGQNFYSGNSTFNYSLSNVTQYFQLYSLFKAASNIYSLTLDLSPNNGSANNTILGYNRLLYVYVDKYNNTIYMPLDVDFVYPTYLSMISNAVINQTNTNKTKITINGTAMYATENGLFPLPQGSSIYLYYDANINYYNATNTQAGGYNIGGSNANIYKYDLNCAFAPTTKSCVLANPLSSYSTAGFSLLSVGSQSNQGNTINYAPNYNSSGDCSMQPNSLLAPSQGYNCNIFGSAGGVGLGSSSLPAAVQGPNGNWQYCVPQFTNGTGYLTSQLGLISTVTTDANGNFSNTIIACGVGSPRIIAQYYGSPGPEPISVTQTPLAKSKIGYDSNTMNDITSPEYNYHYAPNSTTTSYQIGSYLISTGSVYAFIPIIIILILLLAAKASLGNSGSIFDLFGFATLYGLAVGIARGGTGKSISSGSRYRSDKKKVARTSSEFLLKRMGKSKTIDIKNQAKAQKITPSNYYQSLGLMAPPKSRAELDRVVAQKKDEIKLDATMERAEKMNTLNLVKMAHFVGAKSLKKTETK